MSFRNVLQSPTTAGLDLSRTQSCVSCDVHDTLENCKNWRKADPFMAQTEVRVFQGMPQAEAASGENDDVGIRLLREVLLPD